VIGEKPTDFIDVEVVDDASSGKKKFKEEESIDLLQALQSSAKSVFTGITSLFQNKNPQAEESQRRELERSNRFNNEIDRAFEDTGLFGSIVGSLVKSVGQSISNTIAENFDDISEIQSSVTNYLEKDKRCSELLGRNIQSFKPFQSSFFSSSINGVVSKQISLVFAVSGNVGSGQVAVEALSKNSGKSVKIIKLKFQSTGGKMFDVSKGENYDDDVIDAEIL
jgi:hypothetical protein